MQRKKTIMELEREVLPHLAYSPDIALTDNHVCRSLEHTLDGLHFRNIKDIDPP